MSKPFVPGDISPKIDAASDVISPKELITKPMNKMSKDELLLFARILLGERIPESDLPQNKEFMETACDAWEELGNNGEPIQPEDCDTFLDETDSKRERGE